VTTEGPIGVVGAGIMGTGIAQCLAVAGFEVVVVEADPAASERARQGLWEALRLTVLLGRVERGTSIADVSARIRWSQRIDALGAASLVIECVNEQRDLKAAVFTELDRHCASDTVLASGTSAIPIAQLGARTTRPDRVIGLHFMNPAPLTDTVEVIVAERTSTRTVERALELIAALGKRGIVVGDGPGFVLNRVLMLCIAETAAAVGPGTDAATVDAVFEGCLGHPMGPLRTADLIGLDNVVDTINVLRAETGDDRYRVPARLAQLVEAGHFGRKTGRGFHDYS
jgi:3-hydroxybutyryl-CoA dehydrogenase